MEWSDGLLISPYLILEHLLVDAEVGVGVEVVVLRRHLLAGQVLQLLLLDVHDGGVGRGRGHCRGGGGRSLAKEIS